MGKKTRTTESFKAELKEINNNVEVLGEYITTNAKIQCKCKICGTEWSPIPKTLLKGIGCPECGKNKCANSNRKTLDKLKEELSIKCPNIEYYSGEYKNTDSNLFFRCKLCGEIWETTPHSVLRGGTGCLKCSYKLRGKQATKTHEQFIKEISIINPNITILGQYVNTHSKIKYRCLKCGNIQYALPGHLLQGHGCGKCAISNNTKTTEEFIQESKKIYGDRFTYDKTAYINSSTKVIITCKEHGDFSIVPTSFLSGRSCPRCTQSFGENLVMQVLIKNNIKFKQEYRIDMEFSYYNKTIYVDFITKVNGKVYIIEYNGMQHYKPVQFFGGEEAFRKQQKRDEALRQFCNKHNITLIEIPYKIRDYDNVLKYIKDNAPNIFTK